MQIPLAPLRPRPRLPCQSISLLYLVITTLLILFLMSIPSCDSRQKVSRIVRTSQGPVQGILISHPYLRDSEAYLGIPYASPPVENLRFMPPMSPQVSRQSCNPTDPLRILEPAIRRFYILRRYFRNIVPQILKLQNCERAGRFFSKSLNNSFRHRFQ